MPIIQGQSSHEIPCQRFILVGANPATTYAPRGPTCSRRLFPISHAAADPKHSLSYRDPLERCRVRMLCPNRSSHLPLLSIRIFRSPRHQARSLCAGMPSESCPAQRVHRPHINSANLYPLILICLSIGGATQGTSHYTLCFIPDAYYSRIGRQGNSLPRLKKGVIGW